MPTDDIGEKWKRDNPLPPEVETLPPKIKKKIIKMHRKAATSYSSAAFSGAWNDGGASTTMDQILIYISGVTRKMPDCWK